MWPRSQPHLHVAMLVQRPFKTQSLAQSLLSLDCNRSINLYHSRAFARLPLLSHDRIGITSFNGSQSSVMEHFHRFRSDEWMESRLFTLVPRRPQSLQSCGQVPSGAIQQRSLLPKTALSAHSFSILLALLPRFNRPLGYSSDSHRRFGARTQHYRADGFCSYLLPHLLFIMLKSV